MAPVAKRLLEDCESEGTELPPLGFTYEKRSPDPTGIELPPVGFTTSTSEKSTHAAASSSSAHSNSPTPTPTPTPSPNSPSSDPSPTTSSSVSSSDNVVPSSSSESSISSIPSVNSAGTSSTYVPSNTGGLPSTLATATNLTQVGGSAQIMSSPAFSSSSSSPASSNELSGVGGVGGLVGIMTAIFALIIFAFFLILLLCYRRQRKNNNTKIWGGLPSKVQSMATTGTHDGSSIQSWAWDKRSSASSKKDFLPNIAVMDARPASEKSPVSPVSLPRSPQMHQYSPKIPYNPNRPFEEMQRSVMGDDADYQGQYAEFMPPRSGPNSISAAAPLTSRTSVDHPPRVRPPVKTDSASRSPRSASRRHHQKPIAEVAEGEGHGEDEDNFEMEVDLTDVMSQRFSSATAKRKSHKKKHGLEWDAQSRYDGDSEVDPEWSPAANQDDDDIL